ncbi:PH domain-containing protein [Oceanobacillus luteolus]|nr:PH domain-containing protein [Oceanobacillus luteolus]
MMYNKKRLHPAAIIFNMAKPIKEFFFYFIVIMFAGDLFIFFIFLGIFLVLNLIYAVLTWHRYSYYVTDEALWIEYGIFKRTKRSIAKNRIQSIDLTESVLHRLFKLTSIQIETAAGGGSKAEATLRAVTLEEGKRLTETLKESQEQELELLEEQAPIMKKITFQRLLLAGITSGGVGLIIGFLVAGLVEIEELIPENIYDETLEWLLSASIFLLIIVVLMLMLAVYLISVIWVIIRYGNFTIKRSENELIITRGLLERKQLTIPFDRIQAVGIEENIIRQAFGYASVFVEIAGSKTGDQIADSTILFPLLQTREIPAFMEEFVPKFIWNEDVDWVKPPASASPLYLIRSSTIFVLAIIPVFIFFPSFVWIPIVLSGLALFMGWLGYKDAGLYVNDNRLFIRYRRITRVTVQLYHKRVQAFEKRQNVLQRRLHLATMKASIISHVGGRHFHINDVIENEIDQVSDKLAYRKKGSI